MIPATDPATCAECEAVNICDAWVPGGQWKHQKGVEPCRVASEIIDAEEMQRISLRREK